MKRSIASVIAMAVLLTIFPAVAEDDNKLSVPVAFGRGLNTNQAGNPVNHVIIPNEIKTKLDGIVHFLVAGFHQVVVYKPGTIPADIVIPTGAPLFINDPNNQYYLGIAPGGGRWVRRVPSFPSPTRKIVWNPCRFLLQTVHLLPARFSPQKQSRGFIW